MDTFYILHVAVDQVRLKLEINPLTPELNPSTQRGLTTFFTGDFVS
jgi:hypothetical protein